MKQYPPRKGDKKNSEFFEEYLLKVYERREKAGLADLLINMRAVLVQVNTGNALPYLAELYLMTPYRFYTGFVNKTHKLYILRTKPEYPDFIVLEPLTEAYRDRFTSLNSLYPKSESKINTKYLGEVYQTKDLEETKKTLEDQQFRFLDISTITNDLLAHPALAFTKISYYTGNITGYTESDLVYYDGLSLGSPFLLSAAQRSSLDRVIEVQKKFGLDSLIHGIDHLATRVLSGDREDAILEFICLSNYYFWGAYNIDDMNSSTNITRNPGISDELISPAKVFTANNVPFYINTIVNLPSPTEDFVRNYGKRMHHVAYEVEDGIQTDGTKNIDYVVGKLINADIKFLEQIIGECTDFPDLKQIFSKSSPYSLLITEYVQRCHGFEGFFTKSNVAYLTQAAGQDEALNPTAPGPVHD